MNFNLPQHASSAATCQEFVVGPLFDSSIQVVQLVVGQINKMINSLHQFKRNKMLTSLIDKKNYCSTKILENNKNSSAAAIKAIYIEQINSSRLFQNTQSSLFFNTNNLPRAYCQKRTLFSGMTDRMQSPKSHQNQSPNSPQSRFSTDRLKNLLANASNPESKLNIMESYSIGLENSIYRFHNAARRRNFLGRIFVASGLLYISYFLYEMVTSAAGPSAPSSSQNSGFRRNIFYGNGVNDNVRMERSSTKFSDVCGIDEAKGELLEIVSYLSAPSKYEAIGAKLPKGVLLYGPPGNGKTLLAQAVSGEAQVPFFHISGSQFDEQYVGVGAKRVRELFQTAKQNAPCVVFIDEIDSVGGKRTSADIYPYANQTINQLLAELDGFVKNSGVIVIGATNRRDNLDKALLRPGRFDLEVHVGKPDQKGRIELLKHYTKNVISSSSLSLEKFGALTGGFSAADVSNLVNQAALHAAFKNKISIDDHDLSYALDKLVMGLESKSKIEDDKMNWMTAVHEAGHALVSYYTEGAMPLNKVTILKRGNSLGHTAFIPNNEFVHSKKELMAKVEVSLGGRAAEEVVFGKNEVTGGCSSDLYHAESTLKHMFRELGMGKEIYTDSSSKLKDDMTSQINESYSHVLDLLKSKKHILIAVAQCLLQYETLNAEQFNKIVQRASDSSPSNTNPSKFETKSDKDTIKT